MEKLKGLFFQELSPEEQEKVLEIFETVSFPRGSIILKEGEWGEEVYILKEGHARVTKKGKFIAELGAGSVIGEMSPIDEMPRSATVILTEDSKLYRITKEQFLKLLEEHPKVAISILRTLSRRLRQIDDMIVEKTLQEERMSTLGKLSSTIIHDIKSPLGAIKGYTELLKKGIKDPEMSTYMETMEEAIDYILNMIEEVLEFGRDRSSMKIQKVNLSEFISDLVVFFQKGIKNKEIDISIDVPENMYIEIDPVKMRRVFFNLLKNSVDAIPERGEINISVNTEGDGVVISLSDTGVGIPSSIIDRIFDPFFSFGKAGTGLGMTVVKKIIDDHDGWIEVDSQQGKGTTFKIYLPGRKDV